MSIQGVAGALAGLSSIPIAVSVASLFNHNGANFELNGSPRAIGANKIRGILFVSGLVMLGAGLNLRGSGASSSAGGDPTRMIVWTLLGVALASGIGFAIMTPRAARDELIPANHQHAAATPRLVRASGICWLALLGAGSIAACTAILLAVHNGVR